MKENKWRILIWGIVMFFFILLGVYGLSLFNSGYGKYGAMKKILNPIAVEFNTLDDVKKLTDIRADVKKDKLVVTYVNTTGKKEKYIFEYVESNNVRYITNTDEYGTNTWTFVAREMIDAVYRLNGGSESIYELYDINSLTNLTLNDGVIFNVSGKSISINLDANIPKNVAGRIPSLKDNNYVKEENLTTLLNDLETKGYFTFKVDDINLYVKQVKDAYEIYVALTEENINRAYRSVANVIKVIKPSVYNSLNLSNGIIQFEDNTPAYQTTTNVNFSEANIFEVDDSIFELLLFK